VKALAIMPVRNELDILPWAVAHLVRQGVQVYVVDNWSTDGSWEMLSGLPIVGRERWPADGPDTHYRCRAMLDHIDNLAAESDADWCMFNDSDEIRRSNRDETMADGFARVEREGYNAINFRLLYFPPVDNDYAGDPERHFRRYTLDHCDCRLNHVKAWKNQRGPVGLSSHGSHRLTFNGLQIYPERWTLKHYPIRSQAHGEAKLVERMARFDPAERARGWHVQYDHMRLPYNFLRDPKELIEWGARA
jgi:hypothetical protein